MLLRSSAAGDSVPKIQTTRRARQPVSPDDIHNRFTCHPATPGKMKAQLHGKVRELLERAAMSLAGNLPPGREAALAITKLEEAMYWANAAIARNPLTAEQAAAEAETKEGS